MKGFQTENSIACLDASRISEKGASPKSTAAPNTKQVKLKLRGDSMGAIKMKVKLKSIGREPRNSLTQLSTFKSIDTKANDPYMPFGNKSLKVMKLAKQNPLFNPFENNPYEENSGK